MDIPFLIGLFVGNFIAWTIIENWRIGLGIATLAVIIYSIMMYSLQPLSA